MSDPAWASRTLLDGFDGILYVRVAAATGALTATDELGFVTGFSWDSAPDVKTAPAMLNLSTKKKTLSGYEVSGSATIRIGRGADTVRNLFRTAITNKARLQLTLQLDSATGEIHTFDQCIVGIKGEMNPDEGGTYEFAFDADLYTWAVATA